jgi:hypothetical protein
MTSIKKLKSENKSLKEQYQAVESYIINEEFYKSETIVNNDNSLALLDPYIGGVTDKSLLYDFDRYLDKFEMYTSALTLNDNEYIDEVSINDKDFTLQTNTISTSFNMSLAELKKFVKTIREDDLNIAIQTLAIAPDESNGTISGTVTMNENFVANEDKEVKDPVYNDRTGITEVFD